MPSIWEVRQEGGTGTWAVHKDGLKYGRSHAAKEQAELAKKNFEAEELRREAEDAAKKKQEGK